MTFRSQALALGTLFVSFAGTSVLLMAPDASSATTPSKFVAESSKQMSGSLRDLAGKRYNLVEPKAKATVLFFVSHDCPISNAYAPEISRIAAEYAKHKVRFFVVYAEPDFSAIQARQHARQYGYKVPLILDNNYQLSHQVGATVTPQAIVLGSKGQTFYRGRVDNLYVTFGRKRSQPTQHDLRQALDAVVAGRLVPHPTTTALGCFIPTESE